MTRLIPDNEISFHNWEGCKTVMEVLLSEGYVLLLSLEEGLYIINYIWTTENEADRNDVVFMARDEFQEKFYEEDEGEP